jgi:hypothetical protein
MGDEDATGRHQARSPVGRNRLPAARMFGIPCLMFLQGVVQKSVRAGYRLCGCTASSSPGQQGADHRLPRGEARAYACGKTSSKKPLNDGVPRSGTNGGQEIFRKHQTVHLCGYDLPKCDHIETPFSP